jgi:hypothetical protein
MIASHRRVHHSQIVTAVLYFLLIAWEYCLVNAFAFAPIHVHLRSSATTALATTRTRPSASALGVDYGSSSASVIDKSGGVLYRTSVFTKDEYAKIAEEIASFSSKLHQETASSVAKYRLGTSLPPDSVTFQAFQDGSLSRLVEQVAGSNYVLSPHIPVEIRVYEKSGACMAWHVDDVLYDPPQLEVVWTLENTSDCVTMWKEPDGSVRSVETDRNSVLLLSAGGPSHCVTSLKRGQRTIVKCAYVQKGASYQEGIQANQFGSSKRKKVRKQKR